MFCKTRRRVGMAMSLLALGVVFLAGCATVGVPMADTPEEEAYLRRVMAAPDVVIVDRAEKRQAIGRMEEWFAKYTAIDLQKRGEERYFGHEEVGVGILPTKSYTITVTDEGSKVRISINAAVKVMTPTRKEDSGQYVEIMKRNSQILRHYILTGEIMPSLIAN